MLFVDQQLAEKLTPELKERYDKGEVLVFPGQDPEKPVVRDAETKRLVKGTGITPHHNDVGQISKETAWKRTNDYGDWLQSKLKISELPTPQDRESADWWWERAQEAAQHAYAEVKCPSCNHVWEHRVGKQDGNLIFKIMELVTGKATQKTEINIRQQEILQILNEATERREITIHTLTPDEVERRRAVVDAQMVDNA
jgi:hypothetical protein